MVTPLMQDLHANLTDIGFLSASFLYTYVLLQIPAGLLVDRFGARMLMFVGCLTCALTAMLFGCTQSLHQALSIRLLMGLASSPAVVGVMYLACRWFPKERFALLAALVEMIGMLGGAIGETSLAHLVGMLGWRMSMGIVGLGGMLLALLILIVIRNHPEIKLHNPCEKIPTRELCTRFLKSLSHRAVWIGCLYGGFTFSVIGGFGGLWAIPFLQYVSGFSVTQSAFISSMIFLGAALGAGNAGFLACHKINLRALMLSAGILSIIFMSVILFISSSFYLSATLFLLLGVSSGFYVLAFAYVKLNTCETIGASAMGLTNMMCLLLGAPILQPLVGHLLAHLNALGKAPVMVYRLGMLPFLLTLILALIIATLVKKPEEV